MFPKFLKLTAYSVSKITLINETHGIRKLSFHKRDQRQLDVFAHALGFSYEIVAPPEDGVSWCLRNGSWTGVMGMLQRREVDMVVGDILINDVLEEDFRVSYPNFVHEITFTTRKHEHVPNPAVFFHPFSIQVWLSIIACIFIVPLLFRNLLRKKHSFVNIFTSTLSSLVGQGIGKITPRSRRDYFMLGSWILSSALLYYFYAAVLLSFLTFPSLDGVRTIEDLAEGIKDGQYHCTTYKNTNYYMYLRNFENPSARVIGNNIEFCETESPVDCLEKFAVGNKEALVGIRSHFIPYKYFYFISEDNFFSITGGLVTRKDFCCASELDRVVHRAWASGILQKISRIIVDFDFILDLKRTRKYWRNPPDGGKLTMTQLKGLFIFLIASHSLAFLVFLIEVFIGRFKIVPRDAVLVSKGKISDRHRPRATKRKKVAMQKFTFNRHSLV